MKHFVKRVEGTKCIATILVALFFFCLPAAGVAEEILTISGTGDSQDLLRTVARAFEQRYPGVKVEVPESVGSGGGIKELIQGKCDFARVARPLCDKEKEFELFTLVFAHSPLVFVTNPSVHRVDNLTSRQVVGIYSGEITNWQQLGGEDRKIYIVNREEGDSSRLLLEEGIPGFIDIRRFAGKILFSTPEARTTLAAYPDTIGYLPLAMVKGTDLRVLRFNGVAAFSDSGPSAQYPLFIPLALVWKSKLSKTAADFLRFLSDPAVRRIILDYGLAPAN